MADQASRVLFLCPGDECRSQMAEAIARSLAGVRIESSSAGAAPSSSPSSVHPLAVRVMAEVGIDLAGQRSEPAEDLGGQRVDFVISLCERTTESCPLPVSAWEPICWGIDNPALVAGSEQVQLKAFRRVRDELRRRIELFLLANRLVDPGAGASRS